MRISDEMSRKKRILILLLSVSVGALICFYPVISDFWNQYHQSVAIAGYVNSVSEYDSSKAEKMRREAEEFNKDLLTMEDRYHLSEENYRRYLRILDVTGTGIMSYLEIPKIHVSLPLYHDTEDSVLQIALGHIPGSSFPIGGKGTHCVISGHTGLPSAKLFTDLRKLKEGDFFLIRTLGDTLVYEVDNINTVLPEEVNDLEIDENKDYCTLVTCTPYGINSHRLLVRGKRYFGAFEAS